MSICPVAALSKGEWSLSANVQQLIQAFVTGVKGKGVLHNALLSSPLLFLVSILVFSSSHHTPMLCCVVVGDECLLLVLALFERLKIAIDAKGTLFLPVTSIVVFSMRMKFPLKVVRSTMETNHVLCLQTLPWLLVTWSRSLLP